MSLSDFVTKNYWKITTGAVSLVAASALWGMYSFGKGWDKYHTSLDEAQQNVSEARDNLARTEYMIQFSREIIDAKAIEAEDAYAAKLGQRLFPEFLVSPYYHSAGSDYVETFTLIRAQTTTAPETMTTNVCRLYTKYQEEFAAKGTCTFIADGWILASYHQIEHRHEEVFESPRSYGILTSRGDHIDAIPGPGSKIEVIATSPRDDLALLRVRESFDYILPVCIASNPTSNLENLTLVRMGNDPEAESTVTTDVIPKAVPTSDIGFSSKDNSWEYKFMLVQNAPNVKHGNSGSPLYNQAGCLAVLVNSAIEDGREFYYTPRIREFLGPIFYVTWP